MLLMDYSSRVPGAVRVYPSDGSPKMPEVVFSDRSGQGSGAGVL